VRIFAYISSNIGAVRAGFLRMRSEEWGGGVRRKSEEEE
jgi:hypothetical protein